MTAEAAADVKVGLRVDVDTLRGTVDGVPRLLATLERHHIIATFFFSVGPDNMGRHLWRLLRPAFAAKMLRSRAASLYGWDILLRGTLWPGPLIHRRGAPAMRAVADAGHEIGLHAWDHHRWQSRGHRMDATAVEEDLRTGFEALAAATGVTARCSAVAAWRSNDRALLAKAGFDLDYNSDCRGESLFVPAVDGRRLQPQVPVTLPTFDEVCGRHGIDAGNYNEFILSRIRPDQLNVYAIHAEVEGGGYAALFDDLLERARRRGIRFVPLGKCLDGIDPGQLPDGHIARGHIPGREGWVGVQQGASSQ